MKNNEEIKNDINDINFNDDDKREKNDNMNGPDDNNNNINLDNKEENNNMYAIDDNDNDNIEGINTDINLNTDKLSKLKKNLEQDVDDNLKFKNKMQPGVTSTNKFGLPNVAPAQIDDILKNYGNNNQGNNAFGTMNPNYVSSNAMVTNSQRYLSNIPYDKKVEDENQHSKIVDFKNIISEKILDSDLEWWKVIFGRLPNVLLNAGFAVLSAVFAFYVVATPVLSIGGVVLALVFVTRAADEIVKIFNRSIEPDKNEVVEMLVLDKDTDGNISKDDINLIDRSQRIKGSVSKEEKTKLKKNRINWKKPGLWKFLSSCLLGIGLILFGIALFIMPASFLGALAGLGLFAKIGAIVAGVAFFLKGSIDYKKPSCDVAASKSKASSWIDLASRAILYYARLYVRNILDCLLYGACAVLGIAALATGGFGVMPLVFAGVSALYAISSLLRMGENVFPADLCGRSKMAKCFEAIALGAMGLALIVGGVFFAPALLGTFGLTATLFTKIASIVMGIVFAGAGLSKILVGARLRFLDLKFVGALPADLYFKSLEEQSKEKAREVDEKEKFFKGRASNQNDLLEEGDM